MLREQLTSFATVCVCEYVSKNEGADFIKIGNRKKHLRGKTLFDFLIFFISLVEQGRSANNNCYLIHFFRLSPLYLLGLQLVSNAPPIGQSKRVIQTFHRLKMSETEIKH